MHLTCHSNSKNNHLTLAPTSLCYSKSPTPSTFTLHSKKLQRMFSYSDQTDFSGRRCVWVNGPVIVGAGPSGLAVSVWLKEQCIPYTVIEQADCIASLWQKRNYDRLKLHLPKKFCQLPKLPFPEDYPEYPTKKQYIAYLEKYAQKFDIKPQFNECVRSAMYDEDLRLWRVFTVSTNGLAGTETEYICQMIVLATGEGVIPEIDGLDDFSGEVIHAKDYKSGEKYAGKKVIVVGCGTSGMEVSLYLSNRNGNPSMVVSSSVHVLPRETRTVDLAMMLMELLPLWLVEPVVAETSGTGNTIEQASIDIENESHFDSSFIDTNEDEPIDIEFGGELELTTFINPENPDTVTTAVITRSHRYLNPKEITFLLTGYVAFVGILLWAKNADFSITNPFMSISIVTYLMANLNLCVLAWIYGRLKYSNSSRQSMYLRCYMILENFYFILCFVTFVSPIPMLFTSHYEVQAQAHAHPHPNPHPRPYHHQHP